MIGGYTAGPNRCAQLTSSTIQTTSLSKQITYLSFALATVLIASLAGFGWWAASNIDDRSIAREARAVNVGLAEIAQQLPVDQDTAAIWDDAVTNLRAGNQPWIADNLADWMSSYFGHDRVYILDAQNLPVRAVENGMAVEGLYQQDRTVLAPLVTALREQMADAASGLTDSTEAVTGLGVRDLVVLPGNRPALVSVRPIVPSSAEVQQAPGSEFLHISLRLVGQSVAAEIGERFEVRDLAFESSAEATDERIAAPLLNAQNRIVGFFTWVPDEPAYELIRDTAPAVGGGVAIGALAVIMLLGRLRRTSTLLEDSKAQASFLAFHDALTGIPNRALFEDRLEQALANRRRTGASLALHYIDLDRFKHVNDTLGHPAGDELIRRGAKRLAALVDEVDTVARLGGDEFAIIQFEVADVQAALALGQKIVAAFEPPFDIAGSEARVGASVGVAVASDSATTAEDLMRQADIALYEAKDNGRARCQLFAGELDDAVREKRALEMDLRAALKSDGGLHLVYQPIFSTHSGAVVGAEALVRWAHRERGPLPPASFIGLAEERGLIGQLGMWVLGEACRYAVSSQVPWVAVNASPLQFRDERFADRVFAVLDETGLEARRLEIEITEGLLLQNSPMVQDTLMRLRARGIRIALDDFGTGYSSISYLRNHGVDKLKIDQSFTAQLGRNSEIDGIVRSIIDLGRAMHMGVTAEGVETEAQRMLLGEMGCNQLQGYLLAKPMTPVDLERMLAAKATGATGGGQARPMAG